MDIEIDIDQDRARIAILGPIDTAGGAELSAKFAEIAKDASVRRAELNLSEAPSITSAGIGKLLAFYKHFDKEGSGLRIVALSPQLEKQFREIHLDQIIPIGS
ncbi:MAG TPA: STAS domain-containing protein [Spirochaetales bacterium]|nr:STAS domain-containing protein [Spirochaetales bacterium]HRY54084.1 STAS domain-containing protein [Spirochaetia bacterium]HRZ65192.1 STAS domain-containing protein [Spirochaetia bacterium]